MLSVLSEERSDKDFELETSDLSSVWVWTCAVCGGTYPWSSRTCLGGLESPACCSWGARGGVEAIEGGETGCCQLRLLD